MIKDNQTLLNRIHVVVDALVIACTYIAAWFIQFEFFAPDVAGKLPLETYMSALVILIPGLLLLYHAFSLYTPKRVQGRRLEFGNIVKANTIALLLFFTIAYMQHEIDFSRKMLCIFYALNIVVETLVRNLIRMVLMSLRRRGLNQKQILLVGYSRAAEQYIDRIIANPQWGYRVRGILDDNVARGTMYKGIKVIGRIENLVVILPENCLDEIAITLGLGEYEKLQHIVALCEKSGVHTKFIPDYNNIHRGFARTSGDQHPSCAADQYFQQHGQTQHRYFRGTGGHYPVFTDHADFCNLGENNFERTADLQAGTCRTAQQAVLYV